MRFRPGLCPDPAGGAYDAPQTSYLDVRGIPPTWRFLRLDSRAFGASIWGSIIASVEPPVRGGYRERMHYREHLRDIHSATRSL